MAFLDEIDKRLTRLGQGALQKTREVSDTAKTSATIRHLEAQRKECLEKLGTNFCAKYEKYADQEEQILIQKIRALNIEIKRNQDEVNRIKGVAHCPNCHAEVPMNSKFCSSCGFNIEASFQNNKITEPDIKCSRCGTAVGVDQMFCVNCGNNLSNRQETENINAAVSEMKAVYEENFYMNPEIMEEHTLQSDEA